MVAERNTAKEFLDGFVEKSEDVRDYVVRATLFSEFESKNRLQQRDRKTRIDKKKFMELLLDYLGEDSHVDKQFGKSDVFLGWKIKNDECEL